MIHTAPRRSLARDRAGDCRRARLRVGRRIRSGQALAVALVALLTGVCLIGLWMTYALRNAYEREAQHRTQTEARLAAQLIMADVLAQAELPTQLAADRLPPNLTAAVALYDHAGRRHAMASRNDPTGELTLPERLDAGSFRQETGVYVQEAWVMTLPLQKDDGKLMGGLYLSARHRGARLSTALTRLGYELPLWLAVTASGLWLMHALLRTGTSLRPARDARAAPVEFVLESYQEVIDRLQSTGRELERLRSDAEHRAVAQAEFSDRLIASIPDALIVASADGTVVLANLAAQTLFGRSPGVPLDVFFADVPALRDLVVNSLQSSQVCRQSDITATIGGHERTLDASVSPIPGAASVLCLVANITELAALRATAHAKETMTNVGEMAAGIAHEFKNSLATMDGYARLLAQDAPDSPAASALRDEVRHLTQVVSEFLTFARPLRLAAGPVDLMSVVEEVAQALEPESTRRDVTLVLPSALPTVAGDAALLRRALENLLRNALEAIPEDATVREVRIRTEIGQGEVTLLVEDSGRGFPPEVASNLFVPFFTTKKQGHGLGLAIVRKIVVGHNGRIEARNLPGGGAQFRVSLPLYLSAEA